MERGATSEGQAVRLGRRWTPRSYGRATASMQVRSAKVYRGTPDVPRELSVSLRARAGLYGWWAVQGSNLRPPACKLAGSHFLPFTAVDCGVL